MIALHPLTLTFRSDRALTLPRPPGPLWRSAIGRRLRQDACITGASTCTNCPLIARCDYGRLFEPRPPQRGVGRHFQNPPRPWWLAPGPEKRVGAGQLMTVEITLTGAGLQAWPGLRRALGRLRLGPARPELVGIISTAPAPVGQPAPGRLTGHPPEIPPVPTAAQVVLDSPLRLHQNGRPLTADQIDPAAFAGALLRRLDALGADGPPARPPGEVLDHVRREVALVEPQLQWRGGARHSRRQGRRIPLGGVAGQFWLTGDLEPLWPWLWTGQWTHVGKSAVMGLGRYRVLPH